MKKDSMNILHIIEDYSLKSGGLRTVVKELNSRLNLIEDINSFILSSDKEDDDDDILLVSLAKNKPWLYSKEWESCVENIVDNRNINLIHVHGVWMYPQYIAAKFALKKNLPFILTPHGMYEPWLWTKGTLKKKVYFNFLVKKIFSKASRIHAITNDEKLNLKKLFPNTKSIEIPNLISVPNEGVSSDTNKQERYILYLGRLDEKKGIDLLIQAFSKIDETNLILKIAGGYNHYHSVLKELVEHLGGQEKVQFLGMVKGEEKMELYKNALVFVAPSYSEVVGMVNLEAASYKTPVITTYQTGLNKEWNNNGGMLINPKLEELTQALKKVLSCSNQERNENGEKLYNFVKENYSWEFRIKDWINTYTKAIDEK